MDAFSHMVTSLGYMNSQERAFMQGYGDSVEQSQGYSPGYSPRDSVQQQSAPNQNRVPPPTASSPSGTKVAAAVAHAMPSMVMPQRAVAMPSRGRGGGRTLPSNHPANFNPVAKPSGAAIPIHGPLPTGGAGGGDQQQPSGQPQQQPETAQPVQTGPSSGPVDPSADMQQGQDFPVDPSTGLPMLPKPNWLLIAGIGGILAWLILRRA